jgi:hypothetical protein
MEKMNAKTIYLILLVLTVLMLIASRALVQHSFV